ncbi:hypothetical protein HMPREF1986_01517 [Oribacterium sp. oral taxon 078 str. F0263]|nr:hypothetical protein HMPREF1986_01517 [Oribacterium sp. oral taxon 078 str. F0263]
MKVFIMITALQLFPPRRACTGAERRADDAPRHEHGMGEAQGNANGGEHVESREAAKTCGIIPQGRVRKHAVLARVRREEPQRKDFTMRREIGSVRGESGEASCVFRAGGGIFACAGGGENVR